MATINDVLTEIELAVKTVPNVRVHREPTDNIDPPTVVFGPLSMEWDVPCAYPTSGTLELYVIAKFDDRMNERLYALLPLVAQAVDENTTHATVRSSVPGLYPTGNTSLPAQILTIEISLGG
ncbi:hypothetical protein ACIA2T_19695 [Amycolatopsis japonica]|uniref:hypothetical protein n=1 Tax=Amycolatopsis japonica TaxID=208439 RepID=UPI0037A163FD